jgi:enoyl-CoA hydratase/carnithine racemase
MSGEVLQARDGEIATVTLSNPDKLNALDDAMWQQLGEVMAAVSADEAVRCVVLRGAGEKAFAAGADISSFGDERNDVAQAKAYAAVTHASLDALHNCRHPVVAMIHGVCVGGGLEVASLCDIRICGDSSRFGIPVNKLGLVVDYPEMKGLVDLVGPAVATEILLEARVFGAAEAKDKGLVHRVVPDAEVEAAALESARRIAAGAPLVNRWHRKFIRRLADSAPLTPEERDEPYLCFGTEDFQIGFRAFLAKQKPAFKGK